MTKQKLAEVLGVDEWPASYDAEFERFQSEWHQIKDMPIVDWEAVSLLSEEGYIADEGIADMKTCVEKVLSDESLHFALQCVYYALYEYRGAHQNELYIDPAPPSLGDYRYTFSMVILTKCLVKGVLKARERGIPEEMIAQHKGEANGGPLDGNGPYGTPGMFHWRSVCAFATMYQTGILRFEPERVPEGYRMLRRKCDGKLLMVFTAPRRIDEFGQFASCDEHTLFTIPQAENDLSGSVISTDGRVLDQFVSFTGDEWEKVFDAGDAALSFHIPPDVAYNVTNIVDAYKQAVEFYTTYYPDLPIRSIQSYSWLYSPQLTSMLSENSGICRLNRELYLAPVPSGPDGFYSFVFKTDASSFDIDTIEADTSLKRGFVAFVKNGGRVHNGFTYFPVDTVCKLNDHVHEWYATDVYDN